MQEIYKQASTCAVCAAALIDGDICAALGQLQQQAQELQGEVRQQLLIVVKVASYKEPLSLCNVWQAGVADARDRICTRSGFDGMQQLLHSCQRPAT